MSLSAPLLSIVLPAHNESATLPELMRRIHAALAGLDGDYEIIVVDDGSTDATHSTLRELRQSDPRLRLIRLARNFGKEAALSCGLHTARGQAVVTMDSDLQHPPEMLPDLIAAWRKGAAIVMTVRRNRQIDNKLRRVFTKIYYRLMSWLSEVKIPTGLGDFNLYDRQVVEALKQQIPERNRYMKGIVSWVGFNRALVPLHAEPRRHGKSTFSFVLLLRLALVALTSFSNFPLKIWSMLGVAISLIALGYGGYLTVRTMVSGIDLPGYPSLIVAILFLAASSLSASA
ncbi:MAG: glycosyltransferase family 2 protein [Alphaproteobacteria bacterium]